jgi:hypothetical protein
VGDGFLFAAICAERLQRRDIALSDVKTALSIYDQLTVIKEAPYFLRRVARAKALLARLLQATDRAESARLAGEARSWYQAVGGYESSVRELDALALLPR